MKEFFKNQGILSNVVGITFGSVLATLIGSWALKFDISSLWYWIPPHARATLGGVALACTVVLVAFAVTIQASRSARRNAGQPALAGGVAAQMKLLTAPRRVSGTVRMNAIEDLERMVGLVPVKREVNTLIARLQFERRLAAEGHLSEQIGMHMVFTGPPGVGKTEVARCVGAILRALDVLRSGHVVEVDRQTLVAGYTGQTADRTMKKCKEALDGILFIDEAYQLAAKVGDGADFGKEAITTLMKFMDDNRARMIVIAAGYPNEMRHFLAANPGMSGRFTKYIEFPNYSPKELCEIFRRIALRQKFTLPHGFEPKVTAWIDERSRVEHWANGREMRTLFEKTREAQAVRLVSEPTKDLRQIELGDIVFAMEGKR